MTTDFSGVYTALITPFNKGEVDFDSLKSLIEFQKTNGIQGFVVNGTTAESPTLDLAEVENIYRFVRKEFDGKVIVGTGSNSTKKTIELTEKAKQWGADGALVVTPYYNKPTQQGVVAHFKAVANSVDIPIILYNVPTRTITPIDLESILQLSEHKNIVSVKESQGDMNFSKKLITKLDPSFQVLSGDDVTCFEQMLLGGVGVISVISHLIPKQFNELCVKARNKDDSYIADYNKYSELLKQLYIVSNPIPVKAALKHMDIIASAEMRLPLIELDEENSANMKNTLDGLGLLGN